MSQPVEPFGTIGWVREWHDEDGWGVIDSPETPGGCWTNFSAVRLPGYVKLVPGEEVLFDYEPGPQDGFSYRAVAVRRPSEPPVWPEVRGPGPGYSSELTIRWSTKPPNKDEDERYRST